MGPDGRDPGTPGNASNVAMEGDLSDAHTCHIGDGIAWSRLEKSWRDAEIAYTGHGMVLLRHGRLCEVQSLVRLPRPPTKRQNEQKMHFR